MKSLFLLFSFIITLQAQPVLDQKVPTPKQIIGHELGDKFTSHSKIEKYIFALQDAAPNRVRVFPYGETYEERTLYILVFSSPDNLNRLEEIKANIQQLSDPRKIRSSEVERIAESSPAIAWLSYGVHGNEASSPEAALDVMYQLASRTDNEINFVLQNLVIVIDPLLNPDGHERYVNFQITRTGAKPIEDRAAAEHNEDWPSGRSNHYFFDLNRDWAWLTQKETQHRIKVYQEWKPQVHVDYHEMGYNSSYFFFPSFKPINKNIPPNTAEWGEFYGKANAAAFDAKGWSYWSGEVFDLFYPGFGDSWPSLNGAIGMTYEQGGQVGLRVKRNDEVILTLKDRIEHHVTTSFATLKATADNREKRLKDFYRFFKDAIDEGKNGTTKAFIVDPTKDLSKAAKMISLLRQQGVEISQIQKEISINGLKTYFQKKEFSKIFPAGSYVISLEQPAKRFIMSVMEEEPAISDTFFYDISTWALPVAYGVETYWTSKPISIPTEQVNEVQYPEGKIVGEEAVYAYVFKWHSNDAIKALVWLLQNDYKTHVAMKEFTMNGEKFGRGSIVVPVSSNPTDIHDKMKDLAENNNLTIFSAKSGYTEKGINLGSDRAVRLKKPKIIVITNTPVSSESFGAIWSMFDNQYGIDFVPMKIDRLRSIDLRDYTAIIFPDDWGNGQGYKSQLDSNAVQKIKTWIAGGGTFIGIEGGASFASSTIGKIASVKIKEKKKDEDEKKKVDDSTRREEQLSEEELEKRMTVEERERKQRLEQIPGTMLKVKLDNSHPLGFGYDSIIAVLKTTQTMFELSDKGYNVGIYTKSPRLSGYLSKEKAKMLEETPFLVHERLGGGNIILFADDPNFRLFWDNLNKVFLNSVLLMPSIRDVTMTAE
ncbi:MAG: M14 family zinc carboxypeptidase [Bacteroidota bacterium]|nr:M14 family zinc carboxypeptidase [Bacteroidota bacterium]